MFPSPPFISTCKQTNNVFPGLTADQRKVNIYTRLLKWHEHGICAVCVCVGIIVGYCVLPVLSFTKWSFGTYAPFFRDLFFKAPRLLLLLFRLFCSLLPLSSDSKRLRMTTTDGIKQISVPQSPMADLSPYSTCTCLPSDFVSRFLCMSESLTVFVFFPQSVFSVFVYPRGSFAELACSERPVSHSHSCTFSWHPVGVMILQNKMCFKVT